MARRSLGLVASALFALSGLSIVVSAHVATATTFDFNSGPGSQFTVHNSGNLWTIGTSGPNLPISKPTDPGTYEQLGAITGGITSRFCVDGDFTVTVDFELAVFGSDVNGTQLSLNESVLGVANDSVGMVVLRLARGDGRQFIEAYRIDTRDGGAPVYFESSGLTGGRYRISRVGDVMTGSFATAGSEAFTVLGTTAGYTGYTGPMLITLNGFQGSNCCGPRARNSMDISFDNLIVEPDLASCGTGNTPPQCDAGGPYVSECRGASSTLVLDGTGSRDLDPGDVLTYFWTTDHPNAAFADPTSPSPTLVFGTGQGAPAQFNVKLSVSDGADTASCTVPVVVERCAAPNIGINSACVADSLESTCLSRVFTGQPWDIRFCVFNPGDKVLDNWSFDIDLIHQATGDTIPIKAQQAGDPLQLNQSRTINWPSPYRFGPADKGLWTIVVDVAVKDPANPEPDTLRSNNRRVVTFEVVNELPPISNIGISALCVTDSSKLCTDALELREPWYVVFVVVNKGEKPILNWSFDIDLISPDLPLDTIPLKRQIAGPPLEVGADTTITLPGSFVFTDSTRKGRWQVDVTVTVKDPNNPESDSALVNNRRSTTFVIDHPTANLLALFQAEPAGDGLELRWRFGDPQAIQSVELERSGSSSGPWARVAGERRQVGEAMAVLDRDVEPDHTYYYRLVARRADGEQQIFGPLAGTAGAPIAEFAITRLAPNPTRGTTLVEFTVPRPARLRLIVLDVQGREVAVLAENYYRPGRYQATWNGRTERGDARAGLYFVRYQTPSGDLVRRLALTR